MGMLDGLWLGLVARNFYRQQLGALMAARPNWVAAGLFYLLFAVGVAYFVVNPAIADDQPTRALWRGALLGLVAYATYDLTNHATIKGWPMNGHRGRHVVGNGHDGGGWLRRRLSDDKSFWITGTLRERQVDSVQHVSRRFLVWSA